MAELATLARPYAEAVFEFAKETNSLDTWSDTVNFFANVVADPEMQAVLANPRTGKATVADILSSLAAEQLISTEGQNLIKVLMDNDRLATIPYLAVQYGQLKDEYEKTLKVEVISTHAIDSDQQEELENVLKARFGKDVEVNVTIDEALIGGWVIRAGDQVIDMSIKGRLQQLGAELRS
jgi:F-type H+-transporting ATPase subunit delta